MNKEIRIMITDNCVEFTELFKSRLEIYSGIKVVGVAYNGDQTMSLLQKEKVDFLLLDIVMPRMNGLELLQRIKTIKPKPVVIVVSALSTDVIIQKALSLGAACCFNKPVDCDKLVATLRKIIVYPN
jgi:two-component system response regulator (stage 0 sporulation protein A)